MSICSSMSPSDVALTAQSSEDRLSKGDIPSNTVLLNVYDIVGANTVLAALGMGVHHTGVEIYGTEYAFGRCREGTGVFGLTPKTCPGHVFKESIVLGTSNLTERQVKDLIASLSRDSSWDGTSYHILRRNCNVFSEFLCAKLVSSSKTLPGMYSPSRARTNSAYSSSPAESAVSPATSFDKENNKSRSNNNSISSSSSVASQLEPLTPQWTNRIARFADTVFPNSLCEKIESMDRKAMGM